MTGKKAIPNNLELELNNLAKCIKNSKPIQQYLSAQEQFMQDVVAHKLMEDLSNTQKTIRQKQFEFQVSRQNLEELRSLQEKAQENKVISLYANSQQEAISYLRKIDMEISNLLGIDFAKLAKKTTC